MTFDSIFKNGRTYSQWLSKEVSEDLLKNLFELTVLGPTSANCLPARILFLKTKDQKEKLKPFLAPGNIEKTMAAPVVALVGYDMAFYEKLPQLFPYVDARSWFKDLPKDQIERHALRNGSLQGGYFILAARSLGLDCGPMSGFDADKVDEAFFGGTTVKSNFICNLGYGDPASLHPRAPRLSFNEACQIL